MLLSNETFLVDCSFFLKRIFLLTPLWCLPADVLLYNLRYSSVLVF